MNFQQLLILTAFLLGFITCGLLAVAGIRFLKTGYTAVHHEFTQFKQRAFRALAGDAATGPGRSNSLDRHLSNTTQQLPDITIRPGKKEAR